MAEWTESEAKSALGEIVRRAATDPALRARALADPATVIKEVTGKDLPDDITVRFVDSEGANVVIPLPPLAAEGELSDAELEDVAGGDRCGYSCGSASCSLSAIF
ncbi:MAG: hypothetical protein AAGD38_05785 [Acidobacteriota bacterium]